MLLPYFFTVVAKGIEPLISSLSETCLNQLGHATMAGSLFFKLVLPHEQLTAYVHYLIRFLRLRTLLGSNQGPSH